MSTKLQNYHKKCCDPLSRHKKVITKSIRQITNQIVIKYSMYNLKVGDSICTACLTKLKEEVSPIEAASSSSNESIDKINEDLKENADMEQPKEILKYDLNMALNQYLEVSPLKMGKYASLKK